MATKSFTATAGYQYLQLKLDLSSVSNVAANTSIVSWNLYLYKPSVGGAYNYSNYNICKCTLNETTFIDTINIKAINISGLGAGATVSLGSGSFEVAHDGDGTKSIDVYAQFHQAQRSDANYIISGTFDLDNISRASQPSLSASSVALESTVAIYTNRTSDSFTHTLSYSFGSASGTIEEGVEESTSWTPPASLANQIPNATSGSGTITCYTYSGDTLIGQRSVNLTLSVPDNGTFNPDLSITLSEPSGHTTAFGGYVQSKSKFKINVSPNLKYGSSITSLTVSANGSNYVLSEYDLEVTTEVLVTSGTNTVTATMKDSRGRSVTKSVTADVQEYTIPIISSLAVSRCGYDGSSDDSGAYMKISASASITPLGNHNEKTFSIQYKKTSDESYCSPITWTDGYSYNPVEIFAADVNSSYEVLITATDSFGSANRTTSVSTAFTLIDFHSSGKGIAFGKVSETEDLIDCVFDLSVKGQRIGSTDISSIGDGTITGAILALFNALNG